MVEENSCVLESISTVLISTEEYKELCANQLAVAILVSATNNDASAQELYELWGDIRGGLATMFNIKRGEDNEQLGSSKH